VVQNMIPLRRPQTPEDIGNAVVFLASEEAKEITGQALNIDGGAIFS
jgi:meso-butanediol dehydrogenase/(S,S)-butanediol dehydrogenase/diacetyl reductase